MANANVNKVVYYGTTLIDLTGDDVTAADLAKGKTAHDKSGATITGTSTKDADTSGATATAATILSGQTAGVKGSMVTGTMTNNGGWSKSITSTAAVTVPSGYHDGSGKVQVSDTDLIAGNIKSGVNILGVTGTYAGESTKLQSKSVTPAKTAQTVSADTGYDALSQVTVAAVPYSEADNSYGGKTVTIG